MENTKHHFQALKTLACAAATAALALFAVAAQAAPVNLALASNGSEATQSSTYNTRHDGMVPNAGQAIDGNTDGDWYGVSTITHTQLESQPWWQVSLGAGAALIKEIDIWNRTDCCSNRLNDFNVTVLRGGNVVWQSLNNSWLSALPEAIFDIPSVIGDTVRISLNRTDYLSLAEVQVWGTTASAVPEPGSLALVGLGLGAVGLSRRRGNRPA
ncbi:galactose-binding domain-containing protein [Azohydromonas lata]|uniref:Discoidin domain-containing protein n=1 Tax=Azohydromonas lata TaxID=45677 RepID=A0ABU5IPE5_9BURK|nr:discoidin domain-containing protein [Azohydromonas lata]MDZ5460781.1 discoidin domain-containing protein [Azohydromonas lata]